MRVVRRPLFPGEFDHELVWLAVSVTVFGGGALWLALGLPWPRCPFLEMSGYPCLTCGATRCTIAFAHGNFLHALGWNPLATVGLCALLVFDLYAASVLIARMPRFRTSGWRPGETKAVRIAVVVLIAANWVYLLANRGRF
ncbi:MAG TPA: DUF2752 domain-containing protein [Chthoniobacterales bacterium]|jgi:hypothetical protein|nr:DUF2752 domain-containing protein [Chthoniobacterales bacterium]